VAESLTWQLPDPAATARLGEGLARALLHAAPASFAIYLEGDLGAGKTALVRALLAGLGHTGRVPSPTYTLVEPYLLDRFRVLHVDLYRLRDPAELDDLGLADEFGPVDERGRGSLLLAEWPSRAGGRLPAADLTADLAIEGEGRRLRLTPGTGSATGVLRELQGAVPAGF